jgi:flagellin
VFDTGNPFANGTSFGTYVLSGGTSLSNEAQARVALDAIKIAIDTVSATRGDLGAVQSRLATTVTNLGVTRENFSAAESQIRDVDVASEAAEMTRLTILQQAGASVLAQANQMPGIALKLLG